MTASDARKWKILGGVVLWYLAIGTAAAALWRYNPSVCYAVGTLWWAEKVLAPWVDRLVREDEAE